MVAHTHIKREGGREERERMVAHTHIKREGGRRESTWLHILT